MNNSFVIEWPGWDVVREIGRGSFGAVYEIRRVVRGRTEHAALKVITIPTNKSEISELRAEGYDDESITQYFADSLERIEDEYAMMADMKGHANIVYCDDLRTIQHDDGFGWDIYIKMELLTPMKDVMKEAVTDEQVIKCGIDICNALILCKQLNIVHRDIKPENIFISRDGGFKLGDFGIAKTMEGTSGGTKTGTYDYMAPEVYNNQPYHTEADVYSLGIVLYWLLNERTIPFVTKKRPTPSEKMEARRRRFAGEAIPKPKHGSTALKAIVLKACSYVPKGRYADPAEMKRELEVLLYGSPVLPIPEPEPEPNRNTVRVIESMPELVEDPEEETVGPDRFAEDDEDPQKGAERRIVLLEDELSERFDSAQEMRLALEAALRGEGPDEAERRRKEKEEQERLRREQEEQERLKREAEEQERLKREAEEQARIKKEQEEQEHIRREKKRQEQLRKDQEKKKASESEQRKSPSKRKTVGWITVIMSVALIILLITLVKPFESFVNVKATTNTVICAGANNTVGLHENGSVLTVGNVSGRNAIKKWSDIISISTGESHTVGLKSDRTVVAAGNNDDGQCNVENWSDIVVVSTGLNHTVGLKANGTVVAAGNNKYNQCAVEEWSDIVDISAGRYHTVGLKSDGTVVAVGATGAGQCDTENWTDIIVVSAGYNYTTGLRSDGTVVATGENAHGQCNVEDWTDIISISAGLSHTIGLKSDGTVVAVGDNCDGRCTVDDWTNIVAISAGGQHTVGLRANGTVVAVGNNYYNQCGVKEWIVKTEQKKVLESVMLDKDNPDLNHTFQRTIVSDGLSAGAIKTDGTVIDVNYYNEINNWKNIVSLTRGRDHVVGLRSDGTVVALGDNSAGQCNVEGWTNIVMITAGLRHTIGLKEDGTVVATGDNSDGQCDVNNWTNIISVDCNHDGNYTLAVKSDGSVIGAGDDNYGKNTISEWSNIVSVAEGVDYAIGLKSDGTVVSTGSNAYGQRELQSWCDIIAIDASSTHAVGLKKNGQVVITMNDTASFLPPNYYDAVASWSNVKEITIDEGCLLGVTVEGNVLEINGYVGSILCDLEDELCSDLTDIALPGTNMEARGNE